MLIDWVVPLHQRFEVLSIAFYLFVGVFSGPICTIAIIYFIFAGSIYTRLICGLYVAFLCYDFRSGDRGGRGAGVAWIRNLCIWQYCLDYFPIDLLKTIDLPADRNYLICLVPHGAISASAAAIFATGQSKWNTFFPGIRPKLVTLMMNVLWPVQREILLSMGISAASENSITTLLCQTNDPNDTLNRDGYTSNGVGLVIGGMGDQTYIYPDTYRCAISKRRGFVRIALKTGASLVPAISFGENNLYKIVDVTSSFLIRLGIGYKQPDRLYRVIPNGRGLFQTSFGLLPIRHPVTVVIGPPIQLTKTTNPSMDLINQTHELFCSRLKELFELHKHKYVKNSEQIHLEIV